MTAAYFIIAAIALIAAVVLLWLDQRRSVEEHSERAVWGSEHDLRYQRTDRELSDTFHRAIFDEAESPEVATDVVSGTYFGEDVYVFDLGEHWTVAAIKRSTSSDVHIDLRQERAMAPSDATVELLGAMGQRVMFSTHLDVARRVCDRRMVSLSTNAPEYIQVLWNEGPWTLGATPPTHDEERLDTLLETVRRFTDLLRVLPPEGAVAVSPRPRDPSAPTGASRAGLADERTEAFNRQQVIDRVRQPAAPEEQPRPSNVFRSPRTAAEAMGRGESSGPRRDTSPAPQRGDTSPAPQGAEPIPRPYDDRSAGPGSEQRYPAPEDRDDIATTRVHRHRAGDQQ